MRRKGLRLMCAFELHDYDKQLMGDVLPALYLSFPTFKY